ncbi:MAG: Methylthioribose-1-phosphate isomerase [Alphaproteobacteria bacterium MarineAlpha5_Bin9]|nr:MAG: Methylthioribose-1-phosphate isomerase [Alphaproteobacteria bacterium MarineAlpha5_Bin9]|tara:strand:+ start:3809 stop:4891 length:1083 start_codon:yes stop_codon:yes gene_type:complete
MIVGGKNITTIWYDSKNDDIKIIDQRFLPHELKIVSLKNLEQTIFAIKEMQVRGAPLIGVTAAYGLYLASKNDHSLEKLIQSGNLLKKARPTAVNLSWAVDKIIFEIKKNYNKNINKLILKLANKIRDDDIKSCSSIGENGLILIEDIYKRKKSTINILTHCNAGWLAAVDWGTALSPIYKANYKNIPMHIWVDETRPRNQGFNLTAWELINENISNSLVVDNAGGHLMQKGLVDLCITGTDRTALNGDVCNKIGTYLKALAAFDNSIPFYVAAPISSIDFNIKDGLNEIPIEERNSEEISVVNGLTADGKKNNVYITPKNAVCKNYAFDVTPAKYISKIITEKKIIDANVESILGLKNL